MNGNTTGVRPFGAIWVFGRKRRPVREICPSRAHLQSGGDPLKKLAPGKEKT
jgi:hypothetical protein